MGSNDEEEGLRNVALQNAQSILSARNRAEEALRKQSEWLRVTLASIGDAVISTDAEGRVTYLNIVAETLTGWTQSEAAGRPLPEVFHIVNEETRQVVENPSLRSLNEDVIVGLANHTILISRDGVEHPIDDSAAPIRDAEGSVVGSVLIFRDISERKQADAALRESEEKLRFLADTIPQLTWMAHPDGFIFWYNRRWYEYTGTTPAQMEGWGWQSVHDPDVLPRVLERWKACIASGEPFDMVFPLKGADKQFRPFLTRVNPLRDDKGRVINWFGTNTDITEQVQAAESARQSEAHQRFLSEISAALVGSLHYQSILRQVADLAVPTLGDYCFFDVLTDDDRLERVGWKHVDPAKGDLSESVSRFVPRRDAVNHPIPRAIETRTPVYVPIITDEWLQGIAFSPEHLQFLRDLELTSLVTVPMLVGNRPLGTLTFCYSVSKRRHTTEELRLAVEIAHRVSLTVENAKLYQALRDTDRRKDEFLATLAHELRNPLAPIRNSLQILKMPRLDAATLQKTRDMMERQVHQLVRLVDDLLDVSRVMRGKIELRTEALELASVVARAVETAQPLIDVQGHEFNISLPSESLLLHADPVRLSQVLGNLLANAAKYTEPNGRISLSAIREGDHAAIRVRDNGIGIEPKMLPRVFDLFVQVDHASTRSQGGLGIGLTLVKNLVEMHNGTVEAHSAGLGKGSEFVIRLPLSFKDVDDATEAKDHGQSPTATSSGRQLLVVDDNQDAANSLAMLLRLQGYEVRVAHDGPSALDLVETYRPEMIFLDIGMPGMDGYEVARRLRQRPYLRNVVLAAITGWGQLEDRRRSADAGFDHHLVKPPDPKALDSVLAELKKP